MEIEIELHGIKFNVICDYQPEEQGDKDSFYNGCPEEIIIEDIKHKGVSFYDFIEEQKDLLYVEDLVLTEIKNK